MENIHAEIREKVDALLNDPVLTLDEAFEFFCQYMCDYITKSSMTVKCVKRV